MRVNTYYLTRDRQKQITPHFRVEEFACHDGSNKVLASPDTCELLEKIRLYYRARYSGATIVINSGYRTPSWNKKIGGAKYSQHMVGTAADFVVRKPNGGIVSPLQVYDDINKGRIFGAHNGGLGRYGRFTHIDVGPKRRWNGP